MSMYSFTDCVAMIVVAEFEIFINNLQEELSATSN